ncbi:MAG TPA: sigma-70 family RNA polymerase sigma factor [Baekduia sp.]|nr:sigma-70 family RNA polymerase sigma factor [Baekduia sp.]
MAALDAPPTALSPGLIAGLADDTLVELIAAGSDDAFAALDARYRPRLVRFTRGFVSGGTADAEDAVQDAMVRAVRALRNGSRPEAVGPWLHRIARNCALDLQAARRRHPVVELADHAHPPAEDAQATVERRLGMAGLVSDVGQLPDTQRSALVLRELEGRSYTDIADRLEVTVPAVKSLLVRARQGLKRARDDRRTAASLAPLPFLHRLAERVSGLWEPVAAGAAPKVACVAALAAGAIPVSGAVEHHRRVQDGARAAAAAAAMRTVSATTDGHPTQAERPGGSGAVGAAGAGMPAALRDDCADGSIDGHFARRVLLHALRAGSGGQDAGEYGGCRDALLQATVTG